MKLSIELSKWRCDRPDEWKMDEFIRNAEKLEAERDALAAKCLSLENFCAEVADVFERMGDSLINSARLKRIDSVMNAGAKELLSAHDAEVAKAAFIAGAKMLMGDREVAASEYAARIRAKAKP